MKKIASSRNYRLLKTKDEASLGKIAFTLTPDLYNNMPEEEEVKIESPHEYLKMRLDKEFADTTQDWNRVGLLFGPEIENDPAWPLWIKIFGNPHDVWMARMRDMKAKALSSDKLAECILSLMKKD